MSTEKEQGRGFTEVDCPACVGLGEYTTRRDRRWRGQTVLRKK